MSKTGTTDDTAEPDDRVVRRLQTDDQPTAVRVLRDVRGQPVSASGRDYQQVLYRCHDLVARFDADDATIYLRRQPGRSTFERARVRDGEVTVTDFGVVGAGIVLDADVELLPLEDVDVFDDPDADHRGRGFSGGRP